MTILDKIKSSLEWKIDAAPPVVPEPVAPPRLGPQERLESILGGSLDQVGSDAETSMSHGITVGGVTEIKNAAGIVVGYQPRNFASAIEAGVAGKILGLEARDADPLVVAEARRLQPLARRHALRRELLALDDLPPPQNALRGHERAAFAPNAAPSEPAPAPSSLLSLADQNRVNLHHQRQQIEKDKRDFKRAKFETRQDALVGRVVDLTDPTGERVRLEARLREWNTCNPDLLAELSA